MGKEEVTNENLLTCLRVVNQNIMELRKTQKDIINQMTSIQLTLGDISMNRNTNVLTDSIRVLVNKIDGLENEIKNNFESDELTGKKIYELKNKMGLSWNIMTAKYGVPKSTLQYRYRQYRNKLIQGGK